MSYFDDVGAFHVRFGLPRAGDHRAPELPTYDVARYRLRFLDEELAELETALMVGDLALAADALADLVYVALGTAHLLGLPFDAIWAEVQRANLAKERATGPDDARSKRGHALDVVKPAGWRPPDHRPALRRAGWKKR